MNVKPGTRLFSRTCDAQFIAVRAPGADVDLRCGGIELASRADADRLDMVDGFDGGTLMGKRYVDAEESIELLCTKPGRGALSVGETLLAVRDAKALPASD